MITKEEGGRDVFGERPVGMLVRPHGVTEDGGGVWERVEGKGLKERVEGKG